MILMLASLLVQSFLQKNMPHEPRSVKNQAIIHIIKNRVAHFPETSTAVGVRFNDNQIEILASYGLHDLFESLVKPTPPFNQESKLHTIYQSNKKLELCIN